jgi:uncharacterized protein
MKNIIIKFIRYYQKQKSSNNFIMKIFFLNENNCIFTPTCSQYMIQSIEKYGTIKGIGKGIIRILRCNPFNKGGFDPID